MKRIIILLLSVLPLVCSCEYDFEIRGNISEDKLNVICVINEDGEAYLNVETAIPVNKYDKNAHIDTSLVKLEMLVNGEVCDIYRKDPPVTITSWGDTLSMNDFKFWGTDRKMNPGDVIEVKAKGMNTPEVYTTTLVPSKLKLKGLKSDVVTLKNELRDYEMVRYQVSVDEVDENSYYGILITSQTHMTYYRQDGSTHEEENLETFYIQSEAEASESFFEYGGAPVFIPARYNGYYISKNAYDTKQLQLFSGKEFKDGVMNVYTSYFPSGDSIWYEEETVFEDGRWQENWIESKVNIQRKYQVQVYKVTDDIYYYCRALYMASENILANFGLAPSNFSFSNVKNGFGVCGAISRTDSDWFLID